MGQSISRVLNSWASSAVKVKTPFLLSIWQHPIFQKNVIYFGRINSSTGQCSLLQPSDLQQWQFKWQLYIEVKQNTNNHWNKKYIKKWKKYFVYLIYKNIYMFTFTSSLDKKMFHCEGRLNNWNIFPRFRGGESLGPGRGWAIFTWKNI